MKGFIANAFEFLRQGFGSLQDAGSTFRLNYPLEFDRGTSTSTLRTLYEQGFALDALSYRLDLNAIGGDMRRAMQELDRQKM